MIKKLFKFLFFLGVLIALGYYIFQAITSTLPVFKNFFRAPPSSYEEADIDY